MHNSLAGLPQRVIVDTNVLLDAAFVSDGIARGAITGLLRLKFSPSIDEEIEKEALKKLSGFRISKGLVFDPAVAFNAFINEAKILRLPPGTPLLGTKVHRSDRHVASAAKQYGAWVLTSDAILVSQCLATGIEARLPWDVLEEALSSEGRDVNIAMLFRVRNLTTRSGLIFARVIPGSWASMRLREIYTVCDVPGIGRIYYDGHSEEWAFDLEVGAKVKIFCPISANEIWAICGSYNLPDVGRSGSISIRAGRYPDKTFAASEATLKRFRSFYQESATIGHSRIGTDYWNGHLRALVIGPQGMNANTWKAIVSIPEGAPNPYDSNNLIAALLLLSEVAKRQGLSRYPDITEAEILGFQQNILARRI